MYLRPFSLKLLDWAFRNDVYIIEDDYDSELRYHTAPVPGDISCFCLDPWWAHICVEKGFFGRGYTSV